MSCLPNSCCSPVQCIVWQLWSLHHVPVVFGIVAALLCNTLPHPPTRPYRLLQEVTQSGIDRTVSARICHTLALVWDSRLSAIRWLPRLYLTEANVLFFYVDPRYTSPHLTSPQLVTYLSYCASSVDTPVRLRYDPSINTARCSSVVSAGILQMV